MYPYRYVCVCSYEQVWAHVCVLEGMCSVGVFECRYICTVVCAGLCPDRCGRYVERCVCVHCSWVGLHSSGLQQTALLYSYLSEAQRGAEKSKPEEWSTLMSFWEPAAALSMPLNVISVLTRWGGGGAGTRDVQYPDSAHSEAPVYSAQDSSSPAWLSGTLLPPLAGSSSVAHLESQPRAR